MKSAAQTLFEIAESQQGFFTTKQAKSAGYDEKNHAYHVQTGNWIREHRGIYRLKSFPLPERSDLVRWALWSRNRNEEIEGVYSHETALSIYELSDLNPAKLHMTVPMHFRRMSEVPKGLVLHKKNLEPSDIVQREGFLVTRPLRAIVDLIEANDTDKELIQQALRDGMNRGLITRADLRSRKIALEAREQLENILGEGNHEKIRKVR